MTGSAGDRIAAAGDERGGQAVSGDYRNLNAVRIKYYNGLSMIQTFHDRDTQKVWNRVRVKKFEAIARKALEKLWFLETAESLTDLDSRGLRLEKLSGDRKGQYSIRVNDQYRVCFEWLEDGAYQVELTDYH